MSGYEYTQYTLHYSRKTSGMRSENGSALIFIFIAIALFAALSFAVSGIMRSGNPEAIGQEQARIRATQVLDYARVVRQAAQTIRITNNCEDTQISFENDVVSGYANPNAPGNESCHIFSLAGGGVNYRAPPSSWLDGASETQPLYGEWYFIGESCVYDVGTGSTNCWAANGASDSDLVMVLPYVSESVCRALNDELGISETQIPRINNRAWQGTDKFTGSYTQGNHAIQSDASGTEMLRGEKAGCFEGNVHPPTGTYHFYQVIVPR